MLNILILSAIPQEHRHLRKLTPRWRRIASRPFRTFCLQLPDKKIFLVETGMGARFAADALEAALARSRPDLLVFAGFCGGLHPGLLVGDLCVAKKTFVVHSPGQPGKDAFTFLLPVELFDFFKTRNIRPITAVTLEAPEDKPALAAVLTEGLAAADMETARICEIAMREGLPLLVLRSVSDALNDELGFGLARITGKDGRVAVWKVFRTVLAKPSVLKAFYLAWRRSKRAGETLGEALSNLLRLPAGSMARIARQIIVRSGSNVPDPRPADGGEDF